MTFRDRKNTRFSVFRDIQDVPSNQHPRHRPSCQLQSLRCSTALQIDCIQTRWDRRFLLLLVLLVRFHMFPPFCSSFPVAIWLFNRQLSVLLACLLSTRLCMPFGCICLQDRDHENDEPTWHVCFGCFPLLLGPCLKSFGLLKSSAFAWRQPLTWASLYWLCTLEPARLTWGTKHRCKMERAHFLAPPAAQQWDVCYATLFHINDWGRHRWVSKHVFGFCGCHLQAFAKLARFLIICCDGVWDVKTNQQALENVGMNMQCVLWVFPTKWLENANVNSIQVYLSIYII